MSERLQNARVYWYAPFDNAGELAVARALAPMLSGTLTIQSCDSRFGQKLATDDLEPFTLVRDLPPPAGENGEPRTRRRRLMVALERARRRRQLIASTQPTLIHLHTYNPITDWYEAPLLCWRNSPVIQSIHNIRPHAAVLPRPVESIALRAGYRSFDRVVVAHQNLASRLTDEFGIGADNITVVPLPVVSDAFAAPNGESPRQDETTLLFFGTLRENKGIDGYVRAIELLASDRGLRFVFAGRGDARLESLLTDLAYRDDRVTAELGYISNERRAELYSQADVVVMPYDELPAQSGVLQDSYASGRPSIVTDVGALGPSVREDGTGWVVQPGNPSALAHTIRRVAGDREEQRQLGENARRIATDRTPERIARGLLDLYGRVLESCQR
jgi:glycosyltransferase involved in cell wall biosynthesis